MSKGIFVTGTDTGIGKTLVSCLLLKALAEQSKSVVGMKPIAAGGENGLWQDVELLRAAGNVEVPNECLNPYALALPVAPHMAAEREGITIEINRILRAYEMLVTHADIVVVEGVGGFCVPINARQTTVDLAQSLNLPVVLVVGMRLGCINHALLTVQAIKRAGLFLAGWVANCLDPDMLVLEENITALGQRIDAPLLAKIPFTFTDESDMRRLLQYVNTEKLIQLVEQAH